MFARPYPRPTLRSWMPCLALQIRPTCLRKRLRPSSPSLGVSLLLHTVVCVRKLHLSQLNAPFRPFHKTDVHALRQAAAAQLQQEYAYEPQPMSPPSQYPWSFVSAQLTNAKGNEIFYPVIDNRDRQWARRLEWAIKQHRDLAEDDLDELQAEYEDVIRQSKEAHERNYDKKEIVMLNKRLEQANQALRTHRLYALMV